MRVFAPNLLWTLLLNGCGLSADGAPAPPRHDPPSVPEPVVHAPRPIDVQVSPLIVSAVRVSIAAPVGAGVVFRVERRGATGWEPDRIVAADGLDGLATAPIVGLKPETGYRIVAVVGGDDTSEVQIVSSPAPEALRFEVEALAPERAELARGLVLMSLNGTWSGIVVVDPDGDPVWWVEDAPEWKSAAPFPTSDGQALAFLENDLAGATEDQRLIRTELDGSARSETIVSGGHHMVAELDRDELAWLAYDVAEAPWAGGEVVPVLSDRIRVGDGIAPPRTVMSFFESLGPPWVPCAHGLHEDAWLGQGVYEWTHANSLVWLPERDVFVAVARMIDTIVEVDRATGTVNWQIGGPDPTLLYDTPADAFHHGHLSDAWDGGLLVFDNGGHTLSTARVLEYALDLDANRVHVTWEHSDPLGARIPYLGDARRLPSDHVLVAWATEGRVEEVTRDHELLWRIRAPEGTTVGRVRTLDSLQPRAVR